MINRKIFALLALTTVLTLAFSVARAETQLVWSLDWEGINVRIYAPRQAYPGDNITLQTIVEPKEDLRNVYVTIIMHGSTSDGDGKWTESIKVFDDVDLLAEQLKDQNFTVNAPFNISSGLVYGHVYCAWKIYRTAIWKDRSYEDSFEVTYLKSIEYEQLLRTFEELNASYYELKSKDEARSGELGAARNLMYVFIATTVVSAVTVFVLLMRKPKRPWS